jgi:hypothetical protein
VVEHLRPQSDVAERTESVARLHDRNAIPLLGDAVEERLGLSTNRLEQGVMFGRGTAKCVFQVVALRHEDGRALLDFFPARRERLFGRCDRGGEVVQFQHVLENSVFVALNVCFCRRDLMLHRGVFLVGLDGHELFPEPG